MISKVTSEANFRIATRPFVLKKENINTIFFPLCRRIKSGVLRLVNVVTAKKFLRSRYLSAKAVLAVSSFKQQRSSCGLQDSSASVPQVAARSRSFADTKRSSCACIIFGLYCKISLFVNEQ